MKINIFEGARRIALLLAVLVTGGVLIAAAMNEPYLSLKYSVAAPNAPFLKTEAACPTFAGSSYFSHDSEIGGSVGINLCLLPMEFGEKKELLVPYEIDRTGVIWGAASYSTEISEYERQLEERFELPPSDAAWVEQEFSRRYWQNWKDVIKYLVPGLAIYWALVWAIGWIVRGFAGIPMNRDARPQGES